MAHIIIGNIDAKASIKDPETGVVSETTVPGNRETTVLLPEGTALLEAIATITSAWKWHSNSDPAWFECDDAVLTAVLGESWPNAATQRPADWVVDNTFVVAGVEA